MRRKLLVPILKLLGKNVNSLYGKRKNSMEAISSEARQTHRTIPFLLPSTEFF